MPSSRSHSSFLERLKRPSSGSSGHRSGSSGHRSGTAATAPFWPSRPRHCSHSTVLERLKRPPKRRRHCRKCILTHTSDGSGGSNGQAAHGTAATAAFRPPRHCSHSSFLERLKRPSSGSSGHRSGSSGHRSGTAATAPFWPSRPRHCSHSTVLERLKRPPKRRRHCRKCILTHTSDGSGGSNGQAAHGTAATAAFWPPRHCSHSRRWRASGAFAHLLGEGEDLEEAQSLVEHLPVTLLVGDGRAGVPRASRHREAGQVRAVPERRTASSPSGT